MTTTITKTNAMAMSVSADGRVQPNQSLYIQNLNEKLQKDDLRRALYMLFSTYGPVLDVVALRGKKMRGQAHVLFRDIHIATQAMRACQDMDFFGRPMKISYAKTKSKTLSKLTGQYDPPLQAGQPEAQKNANAPPQGLPPPGLAPSGLGAPGAGPPNGTAGPPAGLPPPGLGAPAGPPSGMAGPPTGMAGPPPGLAPPGAAANAPSPQGVKRPRDESDDEGAPMEEDDDDEGEMDMSEDDD